MSLSDKVLARKPRELTIEVAGEKFLIIGKSKREKAAMFAKSRKKDQSLDFVRLEDVMLSECVLDPENRQPILQPAEWEGINAEIAGPLIAACMQILGMDKQDLTPKDSDSTETSS